MEEEIELTDDEWIRYIGLGLTIHEFEKEIEEELKQVNAKNVNEEMVKASLCDYIYKHLIDNIKQVEDNFSTIKNL